MKILELNPRHAVGYLVLAQLYMNQGETDLAIENGRQAVALNPDLQPAQLALGVAYFGNGNYLEAQASFVQAVRLNENDPPANAWLATVYDYLGATEDAINQWEQYLTIDSLSPQDTEFARQRIEVLQDR